MIGIPGRLRGISGGEKKRLSFASEVQLLLVQAFKIDFMFKETSTICRFNYLLHVSGV